MDAERERMAAEIARLRAQLADLDARLNGAERELEAARAVHAATIESLPFDFWARDREGYCFSQNSATYANWGDLLHKRPEDMALSEEVVATWLANNRRALAGETVRGDVEYEIHGERRYVENILAPVRMGDAIVGTMGVNIDVTARRRALEALRDSEAKLRMVMDAAGVGIWSWEPARDHVVWEPAVSAIFGLRPGTYPEGRTGYLALVHPEDRACVVASLTQAITAGRWENEYRIVRAADGAVRWVLTKGTTLRVGEELRLVGAVVDVTERRSADEQLRQAQKLEAIGQLTAGFAHNFNNLLMGILPNIEFAARHASSGIAEPLEIALESARRARELVSQLMTYAGRQRATERGIEDIGAVVDRAVGLCRTAFDRRIAIHVELGAGAHARANAVQLEQAVLNVLINARDAVQGPAIEAPRVEVSVGTVRAGAPELEGRRAADHVRVRIRDNGAGMDPNTLARVYEPFFTTKEVGKGTGLGLATTHAILRDHEGFVTGESAPGRGTTFSLYLPSEEAPAAPRAMPRDLAPHGGTEKILIVDDEPAVRRVMSLLLGRAGYLVHEAASGDEALAVLDDRELASSLAVVILDVSMPGLPRQELRARLRGITAARVIYCTGYAFDAADTDADDAVLEKPVTEGVLLRTIRQVIDRE
jgi:PAS domain S-box-containing protein